MHESVRRRLPALIAGVAIPAAVVAGAVAIPSIATAATGSGTPTAQELLDRIAHSTSAHYSGTLQQTSDLGLPQLPSIGHGSMSSGESGIIDLVTAPHTAKVYVDGRSKQRVQVLDQLAERDVVHNGSTVWIWDSKQKTALRVTLPSRTSSTPSPATPADLTAKLLAAVGKSSTITVEANGSVANRAVDRLVIRPRTDQTLVSKVVISVDEQTGVPLKVAVDARGRSGDAIAVGFRDISFSRPDAGVFSFTPPKGAKVSTKDLTDVRPPAHSDHVTPGPDAKPSVKPTVTGTGWATVVELPTGKLPASITGDRLFGELTTAVPGGRALQTSLVSVLITDDGRVLAGAVPVATLEAAAQ